MLKETKRILALFLMLSFIGSSVQAPAYAQTEDPMPFMPQPGTMVHLSPEFIPAYLKGIVIHPEDPFKFDFIIYKGDQPLSEAQKKDEYTKLAKYFLASLAIPDEDQWVNLSPYEKDRIIKDDFGKTEMGRDLLAQDYMLKQITASLIYPEDKLGKEFWSRVYAKAQEEYGTTNIPVNTFNKVWILPDDALVYEHGNTAYVLKNHLRVMLEEDYLSLQKHSGISTLIASKAGIQGASTHTIASKIIREIVLPELQREVNDGKNFAPLRQVYSGMLLATWFKRELKQTVLGQVYANRSKVKGVDQDPGTNEEIYRAYLKAYKKGVFNFIKEDMDTLTNKPIPRKYFSGGEEGFGEMTREELRYDPVHRLTQLDQAQAAQVTEGLSDSDLASVAMDRTIPAVSDKAMSKSGSFKSDVIEVMKTWHIDRDTVTNLEGSRSRKRVLEFDNGRMFTIHYVKEEKLLPYFDFEWGPPVSAPVEAKPGEKEALEGKFANTLGLNFGSNINLMDKSVGWDVILRIWAKGYYPWVDGVDKEKVWDHEMSADLIEDELAYLVEESSRLSSSFGESLRTIKSPDVTINIMPEQGQPGFWKIHLLYLPIDAEDLEKESFEDDFTVQGNGFLERNKDEKTVLTEILTDLKKFLKRVVDGNIDGAMTTTEMIKTAREINSGDVLTALQSILDYSTGDPVVQYPSGDYQINISNQQLLKDLGKGIRDLQPEEIENFINRLMHSNFPRVQVEFKGLSYYAHFIQLRISIKDAAMISKVMGIRQRSPNPLLLMGPDETNVYSALNNYIDFVSKSKESIEGRVVTFVMEFQGLRQYYLNGAQGTSYIEFNKSRGLGFLDKRDAKTRLLNTVLFDKNKKIRSNEEIQFIIESILAHLKERFLTGDWRPRNEEFPDITVPVDQWPIREKVDLKVLPIGTFVWLPSVDGRRYLIRVIKEEKVQIWLDDKRGCFIAPITKLGQNGIIERMVPALLPHFSWNTRDDLLDYLITASIQVAESFIEFRVKKPEIVAKVNAGADAAMIKNSSIAKYGGIDLNSANLSLLIKRDGRGVVLPLASQDLAQLSSAVGDGLEPHILSIVPASQSPVFSQLVSQPSS